MLDFNQVKKYLESVLSDGEKVDRAATISGKSRATLYRYRSDPGNMPLSVLQDLGKEFGQIEFDNITWNERNFLQDERDLLTNETRLADLKGERFIMSPIFSNVTFTRNMSLCALSMFSTQISPTATQELLSIREKRKDIYYSGSYKSNEIFNGYQYFEFFHRRNQYQTLSIKERDEQIDMLIQDVDSNKRSHIKRRIFFNYRLPICTGYSYGAGVLRFGHIRLDFTEPKLSNEVRALFLSTWVECHINNDDVLVDFLKNPDAFILPRMREYNTIINYGS
jgi:hypothetical protein